VKESLEVGLSGGSRHRVTAEHSAPHLPVVVLSTPSMIGLIEQTCLETVAPHLDDGETTVGVHVCVSHAAAAREGEDFEVGCRLTMLDRHRLTFETRVTCGDRVVSEGTHERAVIDTSRFTS
jgi:fluoroacetyl-CoA thioesterase